MAQKQYPIINNFSKGELSPRMEGRVEIQGYYNGCKIMKNCIMVAQGGAEKRPGFIHLAEVNDSNYEVRLIPFEVNDQELYILEFGRFYIKIWDAISKTAVSDPEGKGVDTIITQYEANDLSDIQYAQTENKIFFAHADYSFKQLTIEDGVFLFSGASITIAAYSGSNDYLRGDVVIYNDKYFTALKNIPSSATVTPAIGDWERKGQVPSDLTADITSYSPSTTYAQGDYVTHNETVWKCTHSSGATGKEPGNPGANTVETWSDPVKKWWYLFDFSDHPAYYDKLYGKGQWKPTNYNSNILGVWLEVSHIEHLPDPEIYWTDMFVDLSDIISPYTLYRETTSPSISAPYAQDAYCYDSSTFQVFKSLKSGNSSDLADSENWEYFSGNPMFNGPGDYPAAVTFMGNRLYLGGTRSNPQTIYGSKVGSHLNFSVGLDDDDAFAFTIASDRSSRIKWMMAKDYLMIGTTSSEWLASGLTPTSIQILRQSAYGSAYSQAIFVADSLLFFQKGGRKLREYIYSNDNKTYLANDLTFFADHITQDGLVESVYQQNPDSILWSITKAGSIIGLTYDRLNGIAGWHRHETYGLFKSITSIDSTGSEDELWVVVSRSVEGTIKQYIEYMAPRDFGSQSEAIFVDSAITVSNGDTILITNQTWSSSKITITYYGTADFVEDDSIKIFSTGVEVLDGYVFEVTNLNTTAKTFDLEYKGETYTTDSFTDTEIGTLVRVTDVISGLDHLEGETVSILGDGAVFPDQTVNSGQITLTSKCNNVIVGLPYEMELQPQSIEIQGTLGAKRRISTAMLKLYNSLGGYVGNNRGNLLELRYRDTGIAFGSPPSLYTGAKEIPIDSNSEEESSVLIYHNQPLPMTVLAIVTDVSYSRS